MTRAQSDALNRLCSRYGLATTGLFDFDALFGRRVERILEVGFGEAATVFAPGRGDDAPRAPGELSVEVGEGEAGIEARVWLAHDASIQLSARRRRIAGPTGCGLCGVDSLAEAAIVKELKRTMPECAILGEETGSSRKGRFTFVIDPLDDSCIQPSSVDLRLDRLFRVFLNHTMPVIDVKQDLSDLTRLVEIDDGDSFILHPGEFVLGSTAESVSLPDDLVARIEGKSSLGRLGLLIHSTAGFVDAGFSGHITLELSNVANLPITLYPGMKIGQVSFLQMTTPADVPYGSAKVGSKYQGQRGPTPSRYWENFDGTMADGG